MVWVPDLAVRPDGWGLGSGLPRAVPSDGVVALLDELVPGALLQKVVLLGSLVAGGHRRRAAGARAPGRAGGAPGRGVGVRSGRRSWPSGCCSAPGRCWSALGVLPWVVVLGRRWRETGRVPPALLVAGAARLPVGERRGGDGGRACSPRSPGPAARPCAASRSSRPATRRGWSPACCTPPTRRRTAPGPRSSRCRATARCPPRWRRWPSAAPGTARSCCPRATGSWPGSAWRCCVPRCSRVARAGGPRPGRRDALALVVPWAVGLVLALLTWAAPGVVAWLAADRARRRAAPRRRPLAGAVRPAGRRAGRPRGGAADGPGGRAGSAGRARRRPGAGAGDAPARRAPSVCPRGCEAVDYPPSYAAARARGRGPTSRRRRRRAGAAADRYRQPAWNDRRKVLDPMPRWLTRDVVASDRLVIGTTVLAGEDPRWRASTTRWRSRRRRPARRPWPGWGSGSWWSRRTRARSPEVAGRVLLDDDAVAGAGPRRSRRPRGPGRLGRGGRRRVDGLRRGAGAGRSRCSPVPLVRRRRVGAGRIAKIAVTNDHC